MSAPTVVWRPFPTERLISPTRRLKPGNIALSSDDFPTPDGPLSADTRLWSAARSSSSPMCFFTLVKWSG